MQRSGKAVHGTAKFIEKFYRDRVTGDHKKSSLNEHREYVNHAHFIYNHWAALDPQQPNVATKAEVWQQSDEIPIDSLIEDVAAGRLALDATIAQV